MDRRRPGVLGGLLIAAMLTAALTGILFFAWRVAGLPFVPFDTLDWLTRVLPGRLIAFGICTMVSVIRLWDLGPISSTAKAAEQAMAIAVLARLVMDAALHTSQALRPGQLTTVPSPPEPARWRMYSPGATCAGETAS